MDSIIQILETFEKRAQIKKNSVGYYLLAR